MSLKLENWGSPLTKTLRIDVDGCRATGRGNWGITNQSAKTKLSPSKVAGAKRKIEYMKGQMRGTQRGLTS